MNKYEKFPAKVYVDSFLKPDLFIYKNIFRDALFQINYAQCIMLNEQSIINDKEAKLIFENLYKIEYEFDFDSLEYDAKFEDLFFLVEKTLIEKIGVDIAGKLHTGRSRNDMEHTMFRIELRKKLISLLKEMIALIEHLVARSEKGLSEIILLYTHGQPAQASTLAHFLCAVIEFSLRDVNRLINSLNLVNMSPMGAAAITTTGFPLNRERMANLLGFESIVQNSYGAIASCDYITSTYSSLKIASINLGRFVQELVTWTGFEVSQIYVPDGFVQISSIMPQKRNPVPLEHLRLKLSLCNGECDKIINTMHNTPFADMNDSEREVQSEGHKAFGFMSRIIPLLAGFVESIQINKNSVDNRIKLSMATITELADSLVRDENISFRQAHEVSQQLSKELISKNISLDDVDFTIFSKLFEKLVGAPLKMNEKRFKEVCSPEHFIKIRNLPGGPSKQSITNSLEKTSTRKNLNDIIATAQPSLKLDGGFSNSLKLAVESDPRVLSARQDYEAQLASIDFLRGDQDFQFSSTFYGGVEDITDETAGIAIVLNARKTVYDGGLSDKSISAEKSVAQAAYQNLLFKMKGFFKYLKKLKM